VIGEVLGEKPVIGVQRMGSAFSRSRDAAAGLRSDRLYGTHGTYVTERAFPQITSHVSHLTSHREKLSFHASHLSLLTVLIFT
jgi:hypothetical protein